MLEVQKYLQSTLGKNYMVSNRLQQHAVLHKILNSEKLGVFLILTFMLIIATFNIIGSLSMLMIEKKKDIQTFWNLGATQKSIQKIFFTEGMLTVIIGSFLGIMLGLLLATLQMKYGIIGMGEGNFIIHSYPVAIHYADLICVEVTVLVIGLFASWYPAKVLSKRLLKT
jgi:lipoprotein-releasing system permease protein